MRIPGIYSELHKYECGDTLISGQMGRENHLSVAFPGFTWGGGGGVQIHHVEHMRMRIAHCVVPGGE